jgi:hypothetical protein
MGGLLLKQTTRAPVVPELPAQRSHPFAGPGFYENNTKRRPGTYPPKIIGESGGKWGTNARGDLR